MEAGRQKIAAWQGQGLLDLESLEPSPDVPALWVPRGGQALGSAVGGPARGLHLPGAGRGGRGDRAFEQMVLARLIEPSSRDQVPPVSWVIWAWMRSAYGPFPGTLCRAGLPGGDLSGPV